jgi:hypothetical protein
MATDLLPAWPSYAFDHEPLNEGWRLDLPDGTLRSDFEQGPARQRQVFRNAPTTIYGQWAMTPAEFKMFKAFQNIVGGGQFTAPIFVDENYVEARISFKKGTVTTQRSGGEWIVTAQAETMDKLIDSEAEYVVNLLTFGTDEDVATLLGIFHQAVHYGFSEVP